MRGNDAGKVEFTFRKNLIENFFIAGAANWDTLARVTAFVPTERKFVAGMCLAKTDT